MSQSLLSFKHTRVVVLSLTLTLMDIGAVVVIAFLQAHSRRHAQPNLDPDGHWCCGGWLSVC